MVKTIIAILTVDEETLEQNGGDFEGEMGWAAQSGIHLGAYAEVSEEEAERIMREVEGVTA